MNGGININVDIDSDFPAEAADAMTMVAAIKLASESMKRLGLTKEQAVARAGAAIAAAWED